jgi:hypothetical protein
MLTPVCDDHPNQRYHNALEVIISGGYGMFFDNIDGDPHVFLCHDCAHESCCALPWLAQLIHPQNSHGHTAEYWTAHPDHAGWDKSAG